MLTTRPSHIIIRTSKKHQGCFTFLLPSYVRNTSILSSGSRNIPTRKFPPGEKFLEKIPRGVGFRIPSHPTDLACTVVAVTQSLSEFRSVTEVSLLGSGLGWNQYSAMDDCSSHGRSSCSKRTHLLIFLILLYLLGANQMPSGMT